jgi:hypothetical protein
MINKIKIAMTIKISVKPKEASKSDCSEETDSSLVVGDIEGEIVGDREGSDVVVGRIVGDVVGPMLGSINAVGMKDGEKVGSIVGY